jgi:PAS domain S-box-containing protein
MTSGVLGGALTSTARALGALWANQRSAHALEQERSRLSAVIDHSDVAILAIDPAGRIAVWNVAMSHLTGIASRDAVGKRDQDLFFLYDEDESRVHLADTPRGSVRLVTHAGRSLWVQVSSSTPADPSARELLTAVFVDESAQRQLESMRHLLLNSVHHELHGPLTAIRGHAQLLGETLPARETTTGSLEAILDAVEMMQHVVGDMVLVIDADPAATPATKAVPVDVASVLRRTLRGTPSVSARAELDAPDGTVVSGDPVRLRQCIMLVLGNAEKYAPTGKITLTVRERDGRYGVISIADEGPGIPAEEQRLVLKPYYRSAAEDLPGSGMGLHIANVMMTAMHGRIELATASSGGLRVSLWLPLATG